jgi:hypothetical protein
VSKILESGARGLPAQHALGGPGLALEHVDKIVLVRLADPAA